MINIYKLEKINTNKLIPVCIQTYRETYKNAYSGEDLNKYIEERFTEEKLIEEIENPSNLFYLAELNNEIAGYLKVTLNGIPKKNNNIVIYEKGLELVRIYILNKFKRKGIGKLLFNKVIELAKVNNKEFIWLGVWEKNPEAINFYKSFGFEKYDSYVFKFGNTENTDILMKKDI